MGITSKMELVWLARGIVRNAAMPPLALNVTQIFI
jgi:hypothetical protein